jgi:hypothetical protein
LDAIGNNSNDAIVVSGSRDATLLVWYWNGKQQRISANGRPGMYHITGVREVKQQSWKE